MKYILDYALTNIYSFPSTKVVLVKLLENSYSIIGQNTVLPLLAGIVVLYAALMTAFDERRYELSLMRALGARQQQLRRALLTELASVGAIAGLIAGGGALAVGQLLAHQVFQLELGLNWWLLPASLFGGAVFSAGIGWIGMRRLLHSPPMLVLRGGV